VEILKEYVVSCFALLKLLLISISHSLFDMMQEFFALHYHVPIFGDRIVNNKVKRGDFQV